MQQTTRNRQPSAQPPPPLPPLSSPPIGALSLPERAEPSHTPARNFHTAHLRHPPRASADTQTLPQGVSHPSLARAFRGSPPAMCHSPVTFLRAGVSLPRHLSPVTPPSPVTRARCTSSTCRGPCPRDTSRRCGRSLHAWPRGCQRPRRPPGSRRR